MIRDEKEGHKISSIAQLIERPYCHVSPKYD